MSQDTLVEVAEPVEADAPAEPNQLDDQAQADDLLLADLLVEEVSIDGMCGVY